MNPPLRVRWLLFAPLAENEKLAENEDDKETPEEKQLRVQDRLNTLNERQLAAYKAIYAGVTGKSQQRLFFIDGPGGSGKSYEYDTLQMVLRSEGKIVLAFATTGIAAELINGTTMHSGFMLSIKLPMRTHMKSHHERAKKLIAADLIVIDEVTMMTCWALNCIDGLLRRLMRNKIPFGGKCIVLGGDFRQILPVLKHKSQQDVVNATLKNAESWHLFKKLPLFANMRSKGQEEFNKWLLSVGNGELRMPDIGADIIELPAANEVASLDELIAKIYSDPNEDKELLARKIIVTPKNKYSIEINNKVTERLTGDMHVLLSADKMIEDRQINQIYQDAITPEYLNTLGDRTSGMPPHKLHIKVGSIVMLIRNVVPSAGLLNGTRLFVREVNVNYLYCEILTGKRAGDCHIIPRLVLEPSETDELAGLKWSRRQFPVIPAFCITINKSQGQSFDRVGIYLPDCIFSHGQLYVALSRTRDGSNLFYCVEKNLNQGHLINNSNRLFTKNIVYRNVFDDDPAEDKFGKSKSVE